jgi:hypothetical protein
MDSPYAGRISNSTGCGGTILSDHIGHRAQPDAIYFDMTARALGYDAGAFSLSDGTVVLKIGCTTLTLEAWWAKYERVEEMPPALREFLGFVRAVFNAQKKSEPVPVAVPQSATEF